MSEYTLEEIAVECGIGNRSHLANLFRDATGQPPGQWRRSHATPSGIRTMRPFTQKRSVSARAAVALAVQPKTIAPTVDPHL
jgi:AraC-like DNA-binding protein